MLLTSVIVDVSVVVYVDVVYPGPHEGSEPGGLFLQHSSWYSGPTEAQVDPGGPGSHEGSDPGGLPLQHSSWYSGPTEAQVDPGGPKDRL